MSPRVLRPLTALAVFLVALAVYVKTAAPTVALVDSGALTVAAWGLGVPHPPGFPLFTMLTHLATLLPLGSVAVRANLASAFFAALACALTALAAWELGPSSRASAAASLFAGLSLAFARTLWGYATVTEVYALNTCLFAAMVWLMLRWRSTRDDRRLYAAALLFGLALGVHHVTIGLSIVALAVLVVREAGFGFFRSRRIVLAAVLAIGAAAAVYAYLPLAASRRPLLNWGNPDNVSRFVAHVTARQYREYINTSAESSQGDDLLRYVGRELGPTWLPLTLLLAIGGMVQAFRRERTLFWFLLLIAAADAAWFLIYPIVNDEDAYLLPLFVALVLAAAYAVRSLSGTRAAVAAAFLALPLVAAVVHWPYRDRSRFFVARDLADNALRTMDRGAVLMTGNWQLYSPMFYFLEVEKLRPDVKIIEYGMLIRSWYLDSLERRYPELFAPLQKELAAYRALLWHYEHDPNWPNDAELRARFNARLDDLLFALVTTQVGRGAHVYATPDVAMSRDPIDANIVRRLTTAYDVVPRGLVMEYASASGGGHRIHPADATPLRLRGLIDGTVEYEPDDVVVTEVIPAYVQALLLRGRYLAIQRQFDPAIAAYEQALELDPGNPQVERELQRVRMARP